MKDTFSLLLFFCVIILATSCSKDELPVDPDDLTTTTDDAETYLSQDRVPDILFSYNVTNAENKSVTSYLIDKEGNIRVYGHEHAKLDYGSIVSSDFFKAMIADAPILPDVKVSLDSLVHNFKQLYKSKFIEYDTNVDTLNVQSHTSIYGYYFYRPELDSICTCDGGSPPSAYDYTGNYRPILLDHVIDGKSMQRNVNLNHVANWMISLSNLYGLDEN